MIVDDLVEVKVNSTIFNQKVVTTFPFRVVTSSTNPDDAALLANIAQYFMSGAVSPGLSFVACCPQNLNIDTVTAQIVKPVRTRSQTYIYNQPGTDANDAATANTAASIERAGAFAGRSWVGRISIPALAPANMIDGNITAGFLVKMGTLASKMLNAWSNPLIDGTLVLQPCIINRKKIGTPPHWTITGSADAVYSRPQLTVRTQRSRNIGKGI